MVEHDENLEPNGKEELIELNNGDDAVNDIYIEGKSCCPAV